MNIESCWMGVWGSKGYGSGYFLAKYQAESCLIRPPNPIFNNSLNENIEFRKNDKKELKILN